MTTIIVIVVVALVFFVTVCVGAFLVWKRETEMRTDSIKAIEHNLEEMLHELTQDSPPRSYAGARRRTSRNEREAAEQMLQRLREETRRAAQKRNADPFEWVRNDDGFADFSQNGRNVSGTDINQSDEELYEMAKIAGWQQQEAGQPEAKPVIAEPGAETAGPLHRVLERFNETLDALKPDRVDRKRKNNAKDSPEKPAEETQNTQPEAIETAEAEAGSSVEFDTDINFESVPETVTVEAQEKCKAEPEAEEKDDVIELSVKTDEQQEEKKEEVQELQEEVQELQEETQTAATDFEDDFLKELEMLQMNNEAEVTETDSDDSQEQEPGYDVGKSGKKYTALELEELIRE